MNIREKIVSLFSPEHRDLHQEGERNAGAVFNTYYRAHLARFDPEFLSSIVDGDWYIHIITDMATRYGVVVPAHARISENPKVYFQIQAVQIAIEHHGRGDV